MNILLPGTGPMPPILAGAPPDGRRPAPRNRRSSQRAPSRAAARLREASRRIVARLRANAPVGVACAARELVRGGLLGGDPASSRWSSCGATSGFLL